MSALKQVQGIVPGCNRGASRQSQAKRKHWATGELSAIHCDNGFVIETDQVCGVHGTIGAFAWKTGVQAHRAAGELSAQHRAVFNYILVEKYNPVQIPSSA